MQPVDNPGMEHSLWRVSFESFDGCPCRRQTVRAVRGRYYWADPAMDGRAVMSVYAPDNPSESDDGQEDRRIETAKLVFEQQSLLGADYEAWRKARRRPERTSRRYTIEVPNCGTPPLLLHHVLPEDPVFAYWANDHAEDEDEAPPEPGYEMITAYHGHLEQCVTFVYAAAGTCRW